MTIQTENKMGTMSPTKLLVTMSLPMITSMLVQTLYNIIDSYFVAMNGIEALTAVTQSMSAQNLVIAIATGTAVGVNALLSKSLGEGNREGANKIAQNGVFLAFVGYVLVLILGLTLTGAFFDGMLNSAELESGLDISLIRSQGVSYLQICMIGSIFVFMQIMFERLMQSTGRTIYTMYTQGSGAIINMILDPLFILDEVPLIGIKGLGLGATGAAIATIIGQAIACVMAIILNEKYNSDIKLKIRGFLPDKEIIKRIYAIGVPSIIMVGIGSIMYYFMNIILMGVSSFGASIFGVYFKLQSFVFMPVFGLNNSLIAIIAYNYGAGKRKRMNATVKIAAICAASFMLLGIVLMQLIPELLMSIFIDESAICIMGAMSLRIISLSFTFAGVCIVLGGVFQALGYGSYSMLVSFARQLVVLVPCAYLLSLSGELDYIWWSFPIAEVASLLATIILYVKIYKKVIKKIPLE